MIGLPRTLPDSRADGAAMSIIVIRRMGTRLAQRFQHDFLPHVARAVAKRGAPGRAESPRWILERRGDSLAANAVRATRRIRFRRDVLVRGRSDESQSGRIEDTSVSQRQRDRRLWQAKTVASACIDDVDAAQCGPVDAPRYRERIVGERQSIAGE